MDFILNMSWFHIPALAQTKTQAFVMCMQFGLQYYILLVYNTSTGPHLDYHHYQQFLQCHKMLKLCLQLCPSSEILKQK